MYSATKILRDEHEAILAMLQALEAIARKLESGDAVPLELLTESQEFFSMYADRSHHGKEEDLLFPLLEKKGIPRAGGPVGCMLTEHDEGRAFVKAMRANAEACVSGDAAARDTWVQAARGYANLLRNHIWKENEILFRMAERLLSEEEQAQLATQFAAVQAEKLSPDAQARLSQIMSHLTRDLAVSAT